MEKFKVLLFVTILCSYCLAEKDSFDGYKVYRITPFTKDQNEYLVELQRDTTDLDFWTYPTSSGMPVDVMVSPKQQEIFEMQMKFKGLHIETFVENVQDFISEDHVDTKADGNMTWTSYYTLDGINAWLDHLVDTHPAVSNLTIGSSYQGREIKGIKISFKPDQRAVFIEGGIHAREWISPATVTYITNEILYGNESSPFARIARSFDWYIFPMTNPDGYVYTHTTNRLWRKTRSPQGSCFGVDLNRNFDFKWGVAGTSTNPCSDTYGGPVPFSESESKAMADFITTIETRLDVFFSMHSYSQMLLYPYGYTSLPMDNAVHLQLIGDKAKEAIGVKYGTRYQAGIFAVVLYPASGTSQDWVRGTFGTPINYLYELRDTGRYGFVLPPDQILPNSEEVMDSLVAIFEESSALGYFPLDGF